MKRTQESPSTSPSQVTSIPVPKKLKAAHQEEEEENETIEKAPVEEEDYGGWPPPEDDGWFKVETKVERRQSKKVKKVEARMDATPPRFLYDKKEISKRRDPVGIDDIRDLVLHIAGDAPPEGWVRVENPRSIQKVVAILIPGITREVLSLPPFPTSATTNANHPIEIPLYDPDSNSPSQLPFMSKTFSHACPTRAPGDQNRMHSVLSTFFQAPVSGEEKKRRIMERVASEREQEKTPIRYLLTHDQMSENEYPIPSYMSDVFTKPEGWVETPEPSQSTVASDTPIYAIDCEMCQTEEGKELARVCILNYPAGVVVYDQLVKPGKPIVDYLTKWSGITEEALSSATTTFEQVQEHVLSLLSSSPTPILLGHSLESDLKSLKICHPRCIDTAVIYHHPRGQPLKPGLAWLTKKWCKKEIQNRGEGGHDPEEDARACVDLLKKKVANGQGFGEFRTDFESIFDKLKRSRSGQVRTAVVDRGNPAGWHGSKATSTVACKTDEDVLNGLLGVIPSHTFAFGRFTAIADASGWTANRNNDDNSSPDKEEPPAPIPISLPEVYAKLNTQLEQLHTSLPARTALIIFSGHSDPRRMAELNARKAAFEIAIRKGKQLNDIPQEGWWSTADARLLEEEVVKARRGLVFLGIKDKDQ